MTCEVYRGDCLDVLPALSAWSIDLVVTDLPQGITQASYDTPVDLGRLCALCTRFMKRPGVACCFSNMPYTLDLGTAFRRFWWHEWIFEKSKASNFLQASEVPLRAHETIQVFKYGYGRYFPQMGEAKPYNKGLVKKQKEGDIYNKYEQAVVKSNGARYPRSVIYCQTAEALRNRYPLIHNMQKPVPLLRYFIKTFSLPGETVLDMTAGSFATGVAAIEAGRNFIGIEQNRDFFSAGVEWLRRVGREHEVEIITR